MTYEPGDNIADYEILSILGEGGAGKVYRVRHRISDRVEAMKVLLPNLAENPELGDRFIREIKLQATLSHPNIAGLHTALRHENQLLMLMEFVDGMTLKELIKAGPLRLEDAANYMAQALDALSYAHGKGVIHRDVKPANMMRTPEGVIKLLDFGIAKIAEDRSLTKTGFLVGSLPYISPEQIEDTVDIDGRTDIYSLGVTLYQALTGRVPFQADSEYSLMRKHLQEMPVPPMQVMPNVPRALNDIVLKAMEKDRARRYPTAAEMAAALRGVDLSAGASPHKAPVATGYAPSAPVVPEAKKFSNRGLYVALGSVATVIALVVAAIQVPKYFGTSASAPSARNQPREQSQTQQAKQPSGPKNEVPQPQPEEPPVPKYEVPQPQAAQSTPPTAQNDPLQRSLAPAAERKQAQAAPRPTQPRATNKLAAAQSAKRQMPAKSEDTAKAVALAEIREALMLLGSRADAVQTSLDRLKQEQARQGLGLRGDITSSAQRMEYFMHEAEEALKKGDAAAARKYLDSAERETSKLESFLGR